MIGKERLRFTRHRRMTQAVSDALSGKMPAQQYLAVDVTGAQSRQKQDPTELLQSE